MTVNHLPPAKLLAWYGGTDTRANIMRHVEAAHRAGLHIDTAPARRIASWWQAPGNAFEAFAHTGAITTELVDEIESAQGEVNDRSEDFAALDALRSYVLASEIETWAVGHNIAGYVAECDVQVFMNSDYAGAVEAFRIMLGEAPESLAGDECECTMGPTCDYCLGEVVRQDDEIGAYVHATDGERVRVGGSGDLVSAAHNLAGTRVRASEVSESDELCDLCSLDAEVKAILRDEVPTVTGGRVFSDARELLFYLSSDSLPYLTAYWLNRGERMTVAEYITQSQY